MTEDQKVQNNQKTIEKYYVEVTPSKWQKFIHGVLSGFGYGIGITFGTALFFLVAGFVIAKIDFVPIFGHFLAEVIKSAQGNLTTR